MTETWSMPAGSGDMWPQDYERGRPGWPRDAVGLPGLLSSAIVLDLGAGTGKLTRLLTTSFARVVAIEPSDAMRSVLEANCPEADARRGTAQEIPLADASVDAIFAGQSFHTYDSDESVAEMTRVLRPDGAVVLMFNVPAGPWEPSAEAAETLLTARGPSEVSYIPLDLGNPYREVGVRRLQTDAVEPVRETDLPNPHTLDRDDLVSFYASMGWLADLPDDERLPLVEDVRSLLAADTYRRMWETQVYWTRLVSI